MESVLENPYFHYRITFDSFKNNPNSKTKSELKLVQNQLFKTLKREFFPSQAKEAFQDWNLDNLFHLSKKLYQNVGSWSGFKEQIWNQFPESFMNFVVDPYTMWIWATEKKQQFNTQQYHEIVIRARYAIYENLRRRNPTESKTLLQDKLKYVTNHKELKTLSNGIFKRFNWAQNSYSAMDIIKGRVYRMLRDGNIEQIKPKSGLECTICLENREEFRFHPTGYRHHTICGFCLDRLPRLECPFCKIELSGSLMK